MKQALAMVLALCLVAIISGGVLSLVNSWAQPQVAANLEAATEQAVFLVQPEGERYEVLEGVEFTVYQVFDADDRLVGYAMVYEGKGYQGTIRLMAGLNEDLTEIVAIEVLEDSETPGLGALINEDKFKNQFKGLETSPEIAWVKGAAPSEPNQVQAITGATISTRAVVDILNEGVADMRRSLTE